MELLVCIKQVPDDSVTVTLDPATGGPQLKDITPVVNAFDTYALEMATRFKEANGGSVTVVTIGDEAALTPSLRSCLSVGAEHAYVVTEPAAVSALGKSYLLGKAAGKLAEGPFDVIFCGCESTDTADGQAGVQLAEQLGLPVITNVLELEPKDGGISAKQETEEGYRVVEAPCPCVVTVTKPAYEPRYPSIKSKMAARKMPIGTLSAADAGAEEARVAAAPAKRVVLSAPPQRQSGVKIQEKEAAESVRRAMEILAGQKLI